MADTDILPFALEEGANVMTQEDYAALDARTVGFQTGLARSNQLNKVWRQSSFMGAGLAAWMVSRGVSVPDDGDLVGLVAEIQAALETMLTSLALNFTTGDAKFTLKNVTSPGWILVDDGTIGDASSGGTTRANADCEALFKLLWNNVSNTWCPVSGGRGANADADWSAHKLIAVPKMLGRALAVAGTGTGLTNRPLGSFLGEETHQLTEAELPSHRHRAGNGVNSVGAGSFTQAPGSTGAFGGFTGGDQPHNNMPPETFINVMIKL